jgi:protein-S-isoprenylcysteine O-methyltransferase Ste14
MIPLLLILAGVSAVGAIQIVMEIVQKRREHRALREQLGPEYEAYRRRRRGR